MRHCSEFTSTYWYMYKLFSTVPCSCRSVNNWIFSSHRLIVATRHHRRCQELTNQILISPFFLLLFLFSSFNSFCAVLQRRWKPQRTCTLALTDSLCSIELHNVSFPCSIAFFIYMRRRCSISIKSSNQCLPYIKWNGSLVACNETNETNDHPLPIIECHQNV